jgi:hypothetical protein
MKIRLLPEAERDLEIAADFYESQQSGLGSYFNDCLTADIGSMLASMKPTVASSVPFRSVSLFRYTTCWTAILSTFTLFSMHGKIPNLSTLSWTRREIG